MKPSEPQGGATGTRFNLSEWALHHRPLVLYLIVVFALAGVFAYEKLGQSEDPPFTFKVMVVKTNWPGAAARDVEQQVTDRIERKLQELPLEFVRSYSKPGESLVFVSFKDSLPAYSTPRQFASFCGPPAPSTRSMRCATSRSAPTTGCSGWATSRRSRAATSTRRSRRCAGTAARRSASASRW